MRKLIANQKKLQKFLKNQNSKKREISDAQIKKDIVESWRISDAIIRTEMRRASENK